MTIRPFAYAIRTNQRVPLGVARSFLERYAGHPALKRLSSVRAL